MSRRTSAEIINATLLEVFLAFLFVVLTIASFQGAKARQYRKAIGRAEFLAFALDSLRTADSVARNERDSLREVFGAKFNSPYAPPCKGAARPRDFVTILLSIPDSIGVTVNRDELSHKRGQRIVVSFQAFNETFRDIREYSVSNHCHFIARVGDTPTLGKADFKRALKVVKDIFYTYGELL
jgi:hypothetical protein